MNRAKATNKPKSTSNVIAYGFLALLGLPFAFFGLVACIGVLQLGYDDLRMRFWTETPCDVISVSLVENPGDESVLYHVEAEYRYQWNGETILGKRISLTDAASSHKKSHQRQFDNLDAHRRDGRPFPCWVNPNLPKESVLFRDDQWGTISLTTLAAVLFGGTGFGLLGIVVYAWFDDRRQTADQTSYKKPWLSRADWAKGEVVYSSQKSGQILLWVSGGMLLISAPSFLISCRAVFAGETLALLGMIPAAISLLTQWKAHNLLSRWRRFGESVLILTTNPGVIGGEFRGIIRPQRLYESQDGYQLRLTCTETLRSSDDDDSTTSTLFEVEQTVEEEQNDESGQSVIPVLFQIPSDALATEIDPTRDRRTWKLDVKALTARHGYQAWFEVPICRVSKNK